MTMTDEEMKALEAFAQAATPGPWTAGKASGTCWVEAEQAGQTVASWGESPELVEAPDVANARFIAAANPAAVLALLKRVRHAEAQAKEWEDAAAKFL